jgi:hypothetical protein
MLLGAEGVAVCCICIVWMVILLQRVAVQRYSMFSVFMVSVHFWMPLTCCFAAWLAAL